MKSSAITTEYNERCSGDPNVTPGQASTYEDDQRPGTNLDINRPVYRVRIARSHQELVFKSPNHFLPKPTMTSMMKNVEAAFDRAGGAESR
jgi:hypothetical protein